MASFSPRVGYCPQIGGGASCVKTLTLYWRAIDSPTLAVFGGLRVSLASARGLVMALWLYPRCFGDLVACFGVFVE